METKQEQRNLGEIIDLVFKAVAVGMSVGALVLSVLGSVPVNTLVTLLAIGLFCLAVPALDKTDK